MSKKSIALLATAIALIGGDILVSTTDTGIFGTGLPNDLFPIIDCGPGNDRFNASGEILSCEARL